MHLLNRLTLSLLSFALTGCYTPQGGLMPSSVGSLTYYSTAEEPKSISVIDLRNGDNVFEMKIPVGKHWYPVLRQIRR